MKRLSRKKVLEKLEVIFREARPATTFVPYKQPARLFASHGVAFALVGEALEALNTAVDAILEDEFIKDRFSRKYVAQLLQRFVASNLPEYGSGNLNIQQRIDETISQSLKSDEKYTVLIPIGGLTLETRRQLRIGQAAIKLCRRGDVSFPQMRRFPWLNSYLDSLVGQVVGVVQTDGEPVRAQEKAIEYVTNAINVLRFYIRTFHPSSTDVQIRTIPQIMPLPEIGSLVDSPRQRILYSSERAAGFLPFTINDANLKTMKRLHFDNINRLLKKEPRDRSSFQKDLLLAIEWYGTAVDMTDPVLKFLNYAIVLEILLSKQERESDRTITDKLAEGAAFLLSAGYKNRVETKKRIKDLYRIRNAIVHGGRDYVGEKHVREIEMAAWHLILTLLGKRNRFRNKNDLLNWVEEKRLR